MFENDVMSRVQARPAVQRRGRERRRAILDAAEALLAEEGYEAATLKAIGERAGIPIASVYHYFSDRHQVEVELMVRYVRELDARIGTLLAAPRAQTLGEAVDAALASVLDYFRAHPCCVELWFSGRGPIVPDLVLAFDRAQAARLWRHLVARGLVRPGTPELVLRLACEAAGKLVDRAFRRSREGDEATLREARRLLVAYLSTYAPDGPRAGG
ncbi:TetR/AcrR family transcriptional regulator [Streptomyces wedmorensis]|uniref:TetR/AcrR family transcriptional regulator n=1 Tax=Streptomyces wedmorensis TaxID=43759 RepID=A0ABW6IYC9_STRWE